MNLNIRKKIERALSLFNDKMVLHTSPHPDDVVLGYLPYIDYLIKNTNNKHCFLTMTSGFNAVRSCELLEVLAKIEKNILEVKKNGQLEEFVLKKILKLNQTLGKKQLILNEIVDLRNDLELGVDSFAIKFLKGSVREFEEECVWQSFGVKKSNIKHFRADFYLNNTCEYSKDIDNFYDLLLKINPDILTLAVDSKGVGPATHYKIFLIIQEAIGKFYEKTKKNIEIIGYRNVWHQFKSDEANLFFPVIQHDFDLLNKIFWENYKTQVDAMFPNSNYEGNFAQIAIKIMQENLKSIKSKAKNDFLDKNIRGLCFLNHMNIEEFLDLNL